MQCTKLETDGTHRKLESAGPGNATAPARSHCKSRRRDARWELGRSGPGISGPNRPVSRRNVQHKIRVTLSFTNSTLWVRKDVSTRMLNDSGELNMDSRKFLNSESPSDSSGIGTPWTRSKVRSQVWPRNSRKDFLPRGGCNHRKTLRMPLVPNQLPGLPLARWETFKFWTDPWSKVYRNPPE